MSGPEVLYPSTSLLAFAVGRHAVLSDSTVAAAISFYYIPQYPTGSCPRFFFILAFECIFPCLALPDPFLMLSVFSRSLAFLLLALIYFAHLCYPCPCSSCPFLVLLRVAVRPGLGGYCLHSSYNLGGASKPTMILIVLLIVLLIALLIVLLGCLRRIWLG